MSKSSELEKGLHSSKDLSVADLDIQDPSKFVSIIFRNCWVYLTERQVY